MYLIVVRTGKALPLTCMDHAIVERVKTVHMVLDIVCPVVAQAGVLLVQQVLGR